MRRLKKVVSLTVATAIMAAGIDMGNVQASQSYGENILEKVALTAGEVAVPTSTPVSTVAPTKIPVEDVFAIEDGVLKEYKGPGGEVVIPDGVTSIDSVAFQYCTNITNVVIPDGVTSVGHSAFAGCTALTSVTIPDSVTYIGDGAFEGCYGVVILCYVDSYAETYAKDNDILCILCTMPQKITITPEPTENPLINDFIIENGILKKYVGDGGDIVIPDDITSIGAGAFEDGSNLDSVVIPDSVTSIGARAFRNCCNLKNIVISKGVTTIESNAFENCLSLTSVVIPEGVITIESNAFYMCNALNNVELPNSLTTIGGEVFRECSSLITLEIPDSVTSIGAYAFLDCNSLKSLELSNSISVIEEGTFENCTGLTNFKIPENVTSIGSNAFKMCSGLTDLEIPNGVTFIGSYAFCGCSDLKDLTLSNSVTNIENYAFKDCSGLKNIKIPESMKKMKTGIFSNCNNLDTIEIPDSVLWISNIAFSDYSNLKILCVQGSFAETFAKRKSCQYQYTEEKEFEIVDGILANYYGNDSDVVVPEGVTKIGYGAFANCTNLNSVKLPEGVTSIGRSAFRGCENLNTVELPKGLKSIRSYAFSGCSSLNSINIPEGVTNMGCYAFANCSSMTSIKIPEGVTRIGWNAFANCSNLSEAQLPESLSVVGKNIFYNCDKLTNEEIADEIVDTEVHQVYTEADLQQIMNYPQGTFELMNDIVLNESWDTINEFTGVLDGKGYTISNVDTTLFANLSKSSIIKNVNISGKISITKNGESSTFLATNANGTIENCVVKGRIEQTTGQTSESGDYIAGFVAWNNGVIRNCKNEADLVQTVGGGSFCSVAGIAGVNYGTIDSCENTGNIESGSRFTGGIAGGYYITFGRFKCGQIINCTNKGNIYSNFENRAGDPTANSYEALVGGITAQNESFVYGCINEGDISADSEYKSVGGIAGGASGYSYFIRCKNTGKVKAGICGEACIVVGTFDENDNFCVNPGNIIISECENNISGIQKDEESLNEYYLCENAKSENGEIRISRCKNIIGGEIKDTYCESVYVRDKGSVVVEDNGETKWKEIVTGEMIIMNEKEKKDLGLLSKEGISGIFIDNPIIGCIENDGIYTSKMAGNGTLYCIYTDGSIVLHDLVAKEVTVTSIPTLTIVPSVKPEATVTIIPSVTSTEVPTATPTDRPLVTLTTIPSIKPETTPTTVPSVKPETTPTTVPSVKPEVTPTTAPSMIPSITPSTAASPTVMPTAVPSKVPQKTQNITAKNINKTYGDKAFNLGAKTDGNGKLTYTSSDKKVATVSDSGKVTIKGCGKVIITIKALETNEYKAANKQITITVKPKKQKIASLKSTKAKTITVKWKKDTKVTGYIIQYTTDKKFKKNVKSITVSGNKTTSKKISKLTPGKKYYVRVCAYKKSSGKKLQGSYSTVKSVKVKK